MMLIPSRLYFTCPADFSMSNIISSLTDPWSSSEGLADRTDPRLRFLTVCDWSSGDISILSKSITNKTDSTFSSNVEVVPFWHFQVLWANTWKIFWVNVIGLALLDHCLLSLPNEHNKPHYSGQETIVVHQRIHKYVGLKGEGCLIELRQISLQLEWWRGRSERIQNVTPMLHIVLLRRRPENLQQLIRLNQMIIGVALTLVLLS